MKAKLMLKAAWTFFRKPTTPVHVMYGMAAAFLGYEFGWGIAAAMMGGFAFWEYWNDNELLKRNEIYRYYGYTPAYDERNRECNGQWFYIPEGAMDFWEATVSFTASLVILGILTQLGIIARIGWL